MNTPFQSASEDRIAKLERSLQHTQWAIIGLGIAFDALALAWYGIGGITQRQIVAKRIALVDDTGAVRVKIGEDRKDTRRESRAAGVILYDGSGQERGGFGTMDNGRVALGMDAANVPAGHSPDRAGLMVDGDGHVLFGIADNQGIPVMLVKSANSGGTLQVFDATAGPKQIQVRTLGAKGDTQSTMGGG